MPIVAKVRGLGVDYGWTFKLSNLLDVMEYWEKVRSNRVRDGFSNLMRSREMAQLVEVPEAGGDHLSHPDGAAIYAKCLTIEGSGLDALSAFTKDLLSGMLRTLDDTGAIYVNSVGGYFPAHPKFEEYEKREIPEWCCLLIKFLELSPRSQPNADKKPPMRADEKLLLSRRDAAQLLSISQRALDYLVATRRLPTRRIGKRVLIPVADLRKYARADHPEPLAG